MENLEINAAQAFRLLWTSVRSGASELVNNAGNVESNSSPNLLRTKKGCLPGYANDGSTAVLSDTIETGSCPKNLLGENRDCAVILLTLEVSDTPIPSFVRDFTRFKGSGKMLFHHLGKLFMVLNRMWASNQKKKQNSSGNLSYNPSNLCFLWSRRPKRSWNPRATRSHCAHFRSVAWTYVTSSEEDPFQAIPLGATRSSEIWVNKLR